MKLELILLWAIAASMAGLTAWLLRRGSMMSTLSDASIILLLLSMMGVMFLSLVIYLYYPGITVLWILIAFNMVAMSVFLIPLAIAIFIGNGELDEYRPGGISARTIVVAAAVASVFVSEVFMGWAFTILSGSLRVDGAWSAIYSAFVNSASSYWFVFTMAGEMALTFMAMRGRFSGRMRRIIGVQPLMMLLSPTAIANHAWVDVSFLSSSVIMAVVIFYSLYYLRVDSSLTKWTTVYIVCLVMAYALMMTGLLVWFAGGDPLLFVVSMLFQMTIYFYVILEDKRLGSHIETGSPPT